MRGTFFRNKFQMAGLLALSILFTAFVVRYSEAHGRLLIPLTWDDVAYVNAGARAVLGFQNGGVAQLLARLFEGHSLFQGVLAFSALEIFGFKDWAPYALNGVLVFAFLSSCLWLMKGLSRQMTWCLLACALSLRFTLMAVHEFRPDFAAALCTSMGLMVYVTAAGPFKERRRRIASALFALAFLAKPTTAPLIAVLYFAGIGFTVLIEQGSRMKTLKSAARHLLFTVLFCLPYLAVHGKKTANYFYNDVMSADAAFWHFQGSLVEHLAYYVTGPGGAHMLGSQVYALFAGVAAALGAVWISRRKIPLTSKKALLALGALTFIAYAVPTAALFKSSFFGLTFQLMLFFMLLSLLVVLRAAQSRWTTPVCAFLAIALATTFSLPRFEWGFRSYANASDPNVATEWRVLNDAFGKIRESYEAHYRGTGRLPRFEVAVTVDGIVNNGRMDWLAYQTGSKMRFCYRRYEKDLNAYTQYIRMFPIVVSASTEAYGVFATLPSEKNTDPVLQNILADPTFKKIAEIPDGHSKFYYVFLNQKPTGEVEFCEAVQIKR